LSCLTLLGPTVDPSSRPAYKLALRWAMNIPLEPFSLDLVAIRDLLDMGIPRTYATLCHMMRHHIEMILPDVHAPTLVVRGSRDSTVSQEWAEHLVRLLPDGRLAVIPGAPHTVNYNSPQHVARLLETFWREVPAPV
jgi:pimeloyl-ACP methyl ester carboxylesterase